MISRKKSLSLNKFLLVLLIGTAFYLSPVNASAETETGADAHHVEGVMESAQGDAMHHAESGKGHIDNKLIILLVVIGLAGLGIIFKAMEKN